ncbi:MAG TPA: NAD(P)H-dependent oxidoreductase subunit E [Chloroflexi bacterium]|nr:NAD(P)H-dependent oxidoreductase subunit E [Chloroflexota bacterium]
MNVEDRVNEIVDRYGADRTASLAVLQDIQREYNYLPREALELMAERLGMPLGEVYRMATFFRAFSLQPKGEYICQVCLGTACHVRGGPRILEALERELGIKAGNTTSDGKFSLEAVRCLGACALGPILVINEEPHAYMTPDKATKLIAQLTAGEVERAETPPKALPARAPVDLSGVPPAG